MRRSDICLYLGPADRAELQALLSNRNTPRKQVHIRRGSYSSVDDLEGAIYDYLLQHNAKPKPFVWSKTADDIITRERRALDALDEIRGNR